MSSTYIKDGVTVERTPEEHAAWLAQVAADASAPPPVPPEVTMRQARQQLIKTGKLAAVNAALAAIPGEAGELARAEWEFSTVVQRNRPLVLSLGAALSIDLDAMFIAAAAL